jgi:HPt (histidine-containing phosphotransfer) domain-containing protein
MNAQPTQELATAMSELWVKFRGAMFARVDAIGQAAQALAEDRLDDVHRRHAGHEAHKLSGAAGGFGFAEASRLAQEAEEILTGGAPLTPDQSFRLAEIAAALRTELERPLPG